MVRAVTPVAGTVVVPKHEKILQDYIAVRKERNFPAHFIALRGGAVKQI